MISTVTDQYKSSILKLEKLGGGGNPETILPLIFWFKFKSYTWCGQLFRHFLAVVDFWSLSRSLLFLFLFIYLSLSLYPSCICDTKELDSKTSSVQQFFPGQLISYSFRHKGTGLVDQQSTTLFFWAGQLNRQTPKLFQKLTPAQLIMPVLVNQRSL